MKVNKSGFTLVELLVVLLIIAILAAVATPLYLQNAKRARASEAVATMSLIRQALREYRLNNDLGYDILTNKVQTALPTPINVAADGTCTGDCGVNVDAGVAQYYSNQAYTTNATNPPAPGAVVADPTGGSFTNPAPQNFVVYANGSLSVPCAAGTTTNCAIKAKQVNADNGASNRIDVTMDDTGRTFVRYGDPATAKWEQY